MSAPGGFDASRFALTLSPPDIHHRSPTAITGATPAWVLIITLGYAVRTAVSLMKSAEGTKTDRMIVIVCAR